MKHLWYLIIKFYIIKLLKEKFVVKTIRQGIKGQNYDVLQNVLN